MMMPPMHGAHVGSARAAVSPGVGPLRGSNVGVGHRLRLRRPASRAPLACAIGLRQVGLLALACAACELTHRLGEPGPRLRTDAAAAHVDEVRHRPSPATAAVNSAWSNARLSRSAASRSSATLASSRSRSASAWVSLVNAPNGSLVPVLLRLGHRGFDRGVPGGAEFGGVRRCCPAAS